MAYLIVAPREGLLNARLAAFASLWRTIEAA
jgi:hypothetical protein